MRLSVKPIDDERAVLLLRHRGHALRLRAAALTVPYPSGLKRLLAAEPDVEAVIVDRVPPGLAAAAEDLGIGYLDRDGRGRLIGPGFVYVAPPRPNSAREAGPVRTSPFAPRASRVVRALLSDAVRAWRLSDLAALVDLNPGNVHRALGALQETGYVERDGDRYVLTDPSSLLEAWADSHRPPKDRITIPVADDLPATVAELVDQLEGAAAISGEVAAELLAPHLPAQSAIVHCLDPSAWERLAAPTPPALISPWSPQTGRILLDLPDPGVAQFGGSVDGLTLVSPAQLYVDLAREPNRGRQAAEEVRRRLLPY